MTTLVSKLQYKNYEKGEFSDEKPRNLEETLKLIEDFPWNLQRGTDIQVTGPGIVIKDKKGGYLKIALYFNGKFSVYYMDSGDRLYEYHTPELTDECQKVKEYFEGNLDLSGFEKHFFNRGNRAHFVNGHFEYRVNQTKIPLLIILMAFFTMAFVITAVALPWLTGVPLLIYPLALFNAFLWSWGFYSYTKLFIRCKKLVLIVSKGNPIFQFGTDGHMVSYNKLDITEITGYGGLQSRSSDLVTVEISFRKGNHIKFPGMLIDILLFNSKMPEDIKLTTITNLGAVLKNTWNY